MISDKVLPADFQGQTASDKHSSYYLLLNAKLELSLCSVDALCRYDFSGIFLNSIANTDDYTYVLTLFNSLIQAYSPRFLVVSIDPFVLREIHFRVLPQIALPIGAIVCDTHHGCKPLTRILELCIIAKVRSVLLQFNHRHHVFFERIGIPVFCSYFSPDLYQIIGSGQLDTVHSRLKSRSGTSDGPASSLPTGVFVGSTGSYHRYRNQLISRINHLSVPFLIEQTPNPISMIQRFAAYRWILNIPLNGDFNRRFVEAFMAGAPIISEYVPQSQLFFPYSLFKDLILFFRDPAEIPDLLIDNRDELCDRGIAGLHRCLSLFRSGFEVAILRDFVRELSSPSEATTGQVSAVSAQIEETIYLAKTYEELLEASLSADQADESYKCYLLEKGEFVLGSIFDVRDEFFRLTVRI